MRNLLLSFAVVALLYGCDTGPFSTLLQQPIEKAALTTTAGPGGTTAPFGTNKVPFDGPTTVTATPNSGYSFANWSVVSGSATLKDATNSATTVTPTSRSVTILANFVPNPGNGPNLGNSTVIFNANGGTGTMANQTIAIGSSANLNYNTFTRAGYGFTGWNTQANGSGTFYTNAAPYTMGAAGVTLYAQWSLTTFVLSTLATVGGTTNPFGATTVTYRVPTNISAIANLSYSFVNWTIISGLVKLGNANSATSTAVLTTGNATIQADFISSSPPTVVSTLAGSAGVAGFADATGLSAIFSNPRSIASDGTNLYLADYGNNMIRRIVIGTAAVTTLAGSVAPGAVNGTGSSASFSLPYGVATDGVNLYVADSGNNMIRQIVIATGAVTTLAGSGMVGSADGPGASATFSTPSGVTTDGINLYVADTNNNTIRQIDLNTGLVTTLAGSGTAGSSDGIGVSATFSTPFGVATDGVNLYVADSGNNKIRQIVIGTRVVTTLAGSGIVGFTDAFGTSAEFNAPRGLCIDGSNLYIADSGNHNIRQIVIATGSVTTLAGSVSSTPGYTDGSLSSARFSYPTGIVPVGTSLYVVDKDNSLIRVVQ